MYVVQTYVGRDDFQEKIVAAKIHFFAVWISVYFQVPFIYFVERKANSTIKQQNYKGHDKRDGLQFSAKKITDWSTFTKFGQFHQKNQS